MTDLFTELLLLAALGIPGIIAVAVMGKRKNSMVQSTVDSPPSQNQASLPLYFVPTREIERKSNFPRSIYSSYPKESDSSSTAFQSKTIVQLTKAVEPG